jgi:lysophospholipase
MGGNILLRNATMPGLWFERIILSAPMIAISENCLSHPASNLLIYTQIASLFGMSTAYVPGGSDELVSDQQFQDNSLTSDYERWLQDEGGARPGAIAGLATAGWSAAPAPCAAAAAPDFPRRSTSAASLCGGNDTVVSTRAIEDFAVRAKVFVHSHAGLAPEILQETDAVRT